MSLNGLSFGYIKQEEAEEAAAVEAACFPPNEACSKQHMIERINAAPDLFLVAIDRVTGKMAGFLNGIATNERAFRDEFFIDAGTHDPNGLNIMSFPFSLFSGSDCTAESEQHFLVTSNC